MNTQSQLNEHQVEAIAQADAYLNNANLPSYSALTALVAAVPAKLDVEDVKDVLASLDAEPQTVNVGNVTGEGDSHLPSCANAAASIIRTLLAERVLPSNKSFLHMHEAIRQYKDGLVLLGELLPVLQINRVQADALNQWGMLPYKTKDDINQLFNAEVYALRRDAVSKGTVIESAFPNNVVNVPTETKPFVCGCDRLMCNCRI